MFKRATWLCGLVLFLIATGPIEAQPLFRLDSTIGGTEPDAFLGLHDLSLLEPETRLGALGIEAQHLAYDPVGETLLSIGVGPTLLRVDPATGAATEIGALGVDVLIEGITVDQDGTPWALAIDNGTFERQLLRLDAATGAVTSVVVLDDALLYSSVAAVGTRIWAAILDGSELSLAEIDPTTGQTSIGAPILTPGFLAMTTGPDHDSLVFLTFTELFFRGIYDVDPNTGNAVLLGTIGANDSINGGVFLSGIATAPARGITDIPTLGQLGTATLVVLLALAGLMIQRRG